MVISRDGVVLYANPAAVRLLGYESQADLVGGSMAKFLDGESLATMRRRIERMRQTGQPPSPREYPAKRRDGSTITAEITSIFIDFEGRPAVLAFARDVTERVRLRAQLAHADRLASLGMMAAGVAHEINNPLQFVMLAVDLLERRAIREPDVDTLKLAESIRAGVERVAAIVRDLRTFGQYEDESVRPVDVVGILESAERMVAHELRTRAQLVKELPPLPAVVGATTRLEQVFVNLLLNAAHAIPESSATGLVTVRGHADERRVVVEVNDNGAGIAADVLPRIFEPFFTTKSASAGTGLGLSICRDIVTRLGGDISAESSPGKGTTIRVVLPRAPQGAAVHLITPMAVAAAVRRRVLVIDDEPLIVSMVTDILREQHDVIGETNPERGLGRILTDPPYQVVMCDLMMPGLSGMEIYARVARERPGLERTFVFVTAGPYDSQAESFLAAVPNPRLNKPISADQLHSLVHEVAEVR
jgi:PAS domain S-box-containing protein